MIKYEIEKLIKLQSYAKLLEKYVTVKPCCKVLPEYNYTMINVNSRHGEFGYLHDDIIDSLRILKNQINGDNEKEELYNYVWDKIKIYTYDYRKQNNKPTIWITDKEEIKKFNNSVDDSNFELCNHIVINGEDYTSYYDEENLQPYMVLCPEPIYKQYKNLKWYGDRYGYGYKKYFPVGCENEEDVKKYNELGQDDFLDYKKEQKKIGN